MASSSLSQRSKKLEAPVRGATVMPVAELRGRPVQPRAGAWILGSCLLWSFDVWLSTVCICSSSERLSSFRSTWLRLWFCNFPVGLATAISWAFYSRVGETQWNWPFQYRGSSPCLRAIASVVSDCLRPMDCSPPGSSVRGILQARTLQWVAVPSSRGSSWPRDPTCISEVSYIAGGFFTTRATG